MDFWEWHKINFNHIVIGFLVAITAASIHGQKKGNKEIQTLERLKSQYQDTL